MKLRHLTQISDLPDDSIAYICSRAIESPPAARNLDPAQSAVGLLFTEPSTRTRVSFERAAQRLGRSTILVDAVSSSLEKGETMADTLLNLKALKVGTFVIRTKETGALEALKAIEGISIVNAGDGVGEHPTQALLDLATLVKHAGGGDLAKLRGLRLGILGDLKHSRVARSWSRLAPRVGIELVLISPPEWKPDWAGGLAWTDDKQKVLPALDGLMALRIQKERMPGGDARATEDFVRRFHVRASDLKPAQWLMHPGPVNWGIELNDDIHGDARSLILAQVEMGLAVRSVVLELVS